MRECVVYYANVKWMCTKQIKLQQYLHISYSNKPSEHVKTLLAILSDIKILLNFTAQYLLTSLIWKPLHNNNYSLSTRRSRLTECIQLKIKLDNIFEKISFLFNNQGLGWTHSEMNFLWKIQNFVEFANYTKFNLLSLSRLIHECNFDFIKGHYRSLL